MSRKQRLIDAGLLAWALASVCLLVTGQWHDAFSVATVGFITRYIHWEPPAEPVSVPIALPADDETALCVGRHVLAQCRQVYFDMSMVGESKDNLVFTFTRKASVSIGNRPRLAVIITGETGEVA